MRKPFLIILALTLCLSLASSCGKSEQKPDTQPKTDETPKADAPAAEEPAAEEPAVEPEQPAEEPAAEEPAAEEPAAEEPAAEAAGSGFDGVEIPADGVIRTAAELGKVLTDGDLAGQYKVEASELDMSGILYGSLGREDAPFTGSFDFGGCTLKNLYRPLFLYTSGAEIRNLKIADTKIVNEDEIPEDMIRWGLVVSDATDTGITDVEIADTVDLYVCIYTNDACVGGIVGHAAGNCEFVRLSSAAKVATESMKVFVSPLVGWFEGSGNDTALMDSCVFTGTLDDTAVGNDSKVGGIAGTLGDATVVNCANYGKITSTDGGQCAGVVGWACGSGYYMENCLNAGAVDGGTFTGGVMGYSNRAAGEMVLCVNVGEVVGANPDNTGAIGGLIKNTETWSFCYWTEDNCAVGYNTTGNASITDFEACADTAAAMSAAAASGGEFTMDGDRVVINP
ncbi:MAG: hypothetical protein IKQ92_08035 [Clostridia bacterium]|nr:hypothetical protein [Clostridia bacterium]